MLLDAVLRVTYHFGSPWFLRCGSEIDDSGIKGDIDTDSGRCSLSGRLSGSPGLRIMCCHIWSRLAVGSGLRQRAERKPPETAVSSNIASSVDPDEDQDAREQADTGGVKRGEHWERDGENLTSRTSNLTQGGCPQVTHTAAVTCMLWQQGH